MQDNEKKPALRFKGFTDPWEQRKLGELVEIGDIDHRMPETVADGIPYLMTGDFVGTNELNFDGTKMISEEDYCQLSQKIKPEKGDILFARYASVGAARYVDFTRKFLISYSCAIIKKSKKINSKYLYHFITSGKVQQQIKLEINTGSQANIGIDSMKNHIVVSMPPLEEQTKIADALSNLDHLITLHQRKYEKLVNIKKSMLDKMFPKNGASVPEIRFKGFTDLWEQRKLGEIAVFSKGVGYSKNDLCEEGTPIILYGRLYTKYETCIFDVDTFVKEKAGSVYSKGGEVIVPASGETAEDISIASVVVKPGILLGGDLNIVSPTAEYDSAFLALTISSGATHKYLSSLAQGKSVVHLHNSDIQSVSAKFPTKREQEKIHLIFGKIDTLITLHQRKLEKLQNIKKSCLEKMFV